MSAPVTSDREGGRAELRAELLLCSVGGEDARAANAAGRVHESQLPALNDQLARTRRNCQAMVICGVVAAIATLFAIGSMFGASGSTARIVVPTLTGSLAAVLVPLAVGSAVTLAAAQRVEPLALPVRSLRWQFGSIEFEPGTDGMRSTDRPGVLRHLAARPDPRWRGTPMTLHIVQPFRGGSRYVLSYDADAPIAAAPASLPRNAPTPPNEPNQPSQPAPAPVRATTFPEPRSFTDHNRLPGHLAWLVLCAGGLAALIAVAPGSGHPALFSILFVLPCAVIALTLVYTLPEIWRTRRRQFVLDADASGAHLLRVVEPSGETLVPLDELRLIEEWLDARGRVEAVELHLGQQRLQLRGADAVPLLAELRRRTPDAPRVSSRHSS